MQGMSLSEAPGTPCHGGTCALPNFSSMIRVRRYASAHRNTPLKDEKSGETSPCPPRRMLSQESFTTSFSPDLILLL